MSIARNNQTRYKRTNLISERIDGKEIVLNHQNGTIISLNSTASEILSSLKSPKTLTQVVKLLEAKFVSVPLADIKASVKLMEHSGLIQKCLKSK